MSTLKRVTRNELAWSSSTLRTTTRLFIAQQHKSMLYYIGERCGKGMAKIDLEKRLVVIVPLWWGPAHRCWGFQCFLIVLRIKH